jgi:RNA polymerase sigma factor (sigma-70 family)
MKAAGVAAISPETTDEHLVEAARAGSSDAFAALFSRYRPEIARYASRTLGDDGRSEDVVQETFLSALRAIGTLDRPAGFKPWLYRIAHNTCVDHVRRGRTKEVPVDVYGLPPAEEIRLFRQAPSSHTMLTQRQDVEHLRQAFVSLPAAQAEILVLRELEGFSYDEIGVRMGISRSAVESMLFRARRGLRDEYGEIATGERCRSMRVVMARIAEGVEQRRDRKGLERHLRDCQQCRRDAFGMGLGSQLNVERQGVRSRLSRVAAFLPLPGFLQRRTEETSQASAGTSVSLAGQTQAALSHLSFTAGVGVDHAATAIQKAAAVVAAAAVMGGGGFVASETRTNPVNPFAGKKAAATTPLVVSRRHGTPVLGPGLSVVPATSTALPAALPPSDALTPAPPPVAAAEIDPTTSPSSLTAPSQTFDSSGDPASEPPVATEPEAPAESPAAESEVVPEVPADSQSAPATTDSTAPEPTGGVSGEAAVAVEPSISIDTGGSGVTPCADPGVTECAGSSGATP